MAGTAPSSTMQRLEEDFHIVRRTDGFATACRQPEFNDSEVNLAAGYLKVSLLLSGSIFQSGFVW